MGDWIDIYRKAVNAAPMMMVMITIIFTKTNRV